MVSHRRLIPAAALLALSALPVPAYALSSRDHSARPAAQQTTSTTTTTSQSTTTRSSTTAPTTTQTSQAAPTAQAPTTTAAPAPSSQQTSSPESTKRKTAGHDLVVPLGSSKVAHAAGDPGDTISDFKFSPATITINVGDTISWTNAGPTDHTATASNGSFDTGTLHQGQSASHTFTQAGTFAYICSLHPFMHGTVVVQGSSSNTGGSGGSNGAAGSPGNTGSTGSTGTSAPSSTASASPSAGTSTATAASSTPTLPNTGTDLGLTLLVGALMVGAGIAIRRRLRTS